METHNRPLSSSDDTPLSYFLVISCTTLTLTLPHTRITKGKFDNISDTNRDIRSLPLGPTLADNYPVSSCLTII